LSSVRPARIAVLINKDNPHWDVSVQFVLEFLTQLWGGQHSLLIPTDGASIDPVFWDLLAAFDPDYVYSYLRTGKDDRASNPKGFQAFVENQTSEWMKRNPGAVKPIAGPEIERILLENRYELNVSDGLKDEISNRLVP